MSLLEPYHLFLGLLGLFTLVSLALASSTVINVVRLRNVRMSWKAGKMKGYPLFSTLFLGFTVIGIFMGLYHNSFEELFISTFYLALAGGWFVTSFLASKRYITDHGIVKNVNDPAQTVAWYQIRDFLETRDNGKLQYVFIYSDEIDKSTDSLIRLELKVPPNKEGAFKKLISHKLGRRISCSTEEAFRVEEFD